MPPCENLLKRVLIIDGDQRSALAATRSLGRAGIHVVVGGVRPRTLAGSSRYCSGRLVYPHPLRGEREFVDAIARATVAERIDLVIPAADLASAILSEHDGALGPGVRLAVEVSERFWKASDKNQLHQLALRMGIPTPALHFVTSAREALECQDRIPFPCVLKPSRTHVRHEGSWIRTSVRRVPSREEFVSLFSGPSPFHVPCTIQRQIKGDGYGIFALCSKGTPLALFAHHRLREKPPWGGVSVLRESVALEPPMEEYATRLLREIGLDGVGMVEFKREEATGVPYLMEVNARLWGSLQLAIDAGIDFPVLLARYFLDGTVPPPQTYRVGVRSRWLLGDLDHLIARVYRPDRAATSLPPLRSVVLDFLWPFRPNTRLEVERWSDMGPSWHELRAYVGDALRPSHRA